MDFYTELKDSISADHEATENVFQPSLFSEDFNIEDYKRYLLSNYIFFRSHEAYVSVLDVPEEGKALLTPSRADMLESDLQKLQVNMSGVPLLTPELIAAQPEQADTAALGHVYVVAGSAMGAKIISKHLREKPFVRETGADSFLESYVHFSGEEWKAFKQILNTVSNKGSKEAVIKAAKISFGYFSRSYDMAGKFLNKAQYTS
ncbi:MAG: biliverdin-producing heme oxygenase [Cyclobacteriaceae bacterium]